MHERTRRVDLARWFEIFAHERVFPRKRHESNCKSRKRENKEATERETSLLRATCLFDISDANDHQSDQKHYESVPGRLGEE